MGGSDSCQQSILKQLPTLVNLGKLLNMLPVNIYQPAGDDEYGSCDTVNSLVVDKVPYILNQTVFVWT